MQFIVDGPDIPNELLQAHEDGRVVFFCGAGISYPAGLPDFKGLVKQIYQQLGTKFTDIEKEAFANGQFDTTLELLEGRFPGQRLAVRRALERALKPKLRRRGATDTHAALLRLARNREGTLRLVTTNFDRVFQAADNRTRQAFQEYSAPMLPIPKKSRWNGLVYLHGLLPKKPDDTALNSLVVTSGDFGLAYLTERWAARFVSDLFRNYEVCFVGYSINDPVLRYMMDALAADRMQGESIPKAWALGDCKPGQERRKTVEWAAKGVTPILYSVPADGKDHSLLHRTLHVWAETYRDGVQGKEAIVAKYALVHPQASTKQDNFVGRMIWALSDKSGLPAKRFADFNPVPSLDWLEAFAEPRFGRDALPQFGVSAHDNVDPKLRFSLLCRPAAFDYAPFMFLASNGDSESTLDVVMRHLARWLTRHLGDPRLILWIAQRGGHLHSCWERLIENELDRLASLEYKKKKAELDEIILNAPNALPNAQMRTLWRLLLGGRVKSPPHNFDLYRWKERLEREGLTPSLRLELRELLAPNVVLKEPFPWPDVSSSHDDARTGITHLIDREFSLAADDAHSVLYGDVVAASWLSALPHLLEDFQRLLRDTLDLLRELGDADEYNDRSFWYQPSIASHRQNRRLHQWVILIELLRDSWLEIHVNDRARAAKIAQGWFELPYPTFKRLAFFAACQDECIPPEQWVNWLLADNAWWLWSCETKREVCRLLVLQGQQLAGSEQGRLEVAILSGPPRAMYRDDLELERWRHEVAHSVWLRLAKLSTSELALGADAAARLAALSDAHPEWQLATNESDEFWFWSSSTGDPDYEDVFVVDAAPRKRRDLVKWLAKPKTAPHPYHTDDWTDVCRTRFFDALYALCELARNGVWLAGRWRDALQVWSEEGMVSCAWRNAAPLVQTMPDDCLQEIIHPVTWWMKTVSMSINSHEDVLLGLCRRILDKHIDANVEIQDDGGNVEKPVADAINHPIGHITETLINLWFKRDPNDNDLIPADIKYLFTQICDENVRQFRHGRVLLGSRLIALFRVDREWTERYLLPLFNWDTSDEAKAVWAGFLWSPRLYQPLLRTIKSNFLDTSKHYMELGDHRRQFVSFLTYAALEKVSGYTDDDFRIAIKNFPPEGVEHCALVLLRALEGAAEQREDYWENRVLPFWRNLWPKSRDLITPQLAETLSLICIATRNAFPSSLAEVKDWLQPLEFPNHIVTMLYNNQLCSQFPADALTLLASIIVDQQWCPKELGKCLDEIRQHVPNLAEDQRYVKLREYLRTRESR